MNRFVALARVERRVAERPEPRRKKESRDGLLFSQEETAEALFWGAHCSRHSCVGCSKK